jgi:uncharacterized protein (DUF1015 family)
MRIRPFRAYRFNLSKIPDPSTVVAPPYDQIDPDTQSRLYALHPWNVVRITFGREEPGDSGEQNKYRRARAYLDRWLAEQVFVRDPEPALYPYHQTYRLGEATITRRGFIALGEATDYSERIVLPHERTHTGPKEDRLRLLEATGGDFGLVFMLLSDPRGELLEAAAPPAGAPPLVEARDLRGEIHRLWRVTDSAVISRVQALMAERSVIIADGHHRYETALAYRRAHPAAAFKLMAFFSLDAPGCTILPNHRLVRDLPTFALEELLALAGQWFEVTRLPAAGEPAAEGTLLVERLAAVYAAGRVGIGVVAGKASGSVLLTLRPDAADRIAWPPGKPAAWRRLGVSVLHEGLLKPLLGITDAEPAKTRLDYTASATDAVRLTRDGSCQAAFLLHPTTPEELREIVEAGEVLPQKSTHFYPKLLTGLVFARVGE